MNRREFVRTVVGAGGAAILAGTLHTRGTTGPLRAVVRLYSDTWRVLHEVEFPVVVGTNKFTVDFAPDQTCAVGASSASWRHGVELLKSFSPVVLVGGLDTFRIKWELEVNA